MRLMTTAVLLLALTVLGAEMFQWSTQVAALGSPWDLAVWTFGGLALVGVGWLTLRELRGWFVVERLSKISGAVHGQGVQAESTMRRWARRLPGEIEHENMFNKWQQARDCGDQDAACETVNNILAQLDILADREIRKESAKTGVLVMLTGIPLLDAILCVWRNCRLMRRIATIYGARPGAIGTLRLGRMVLIHAVAVDLSQHAADLISSRVGSLAATGGQAVVAAALTARIGLWTQQVCRPLPGTHRTVVGFAATSATDEVLYHVRRFVSRAAAILNVKRDTRAPAN